MGNGHEFYIATNSKKCVRCSACGRIVTNTETEMFRHAKGCWKDRISLLQIQVLKENESYQFELEDGKLSIFTPTLKRAENGRYTGAVWKEVFSAQIVDGKVSNESGLESFEKFWKDQKLKSLEEFYCEEERLEEAIDKYVKREKLLSDKNKGAEHKKKEFYPDTSLLLKLKEKLDNEVFSQDFGKKILAQTMFEILKSETKENENKVLLIKGASGSGKTLLVNAVSKILLEMMNIGTYVVDSANFVAASFSGGLSVQDIKKKADFFFLDKDENRRVLFLDEFDKLCVPNTCSDGENINLTIQSQLLKWIEMPLENCSTLFILAGAFQNFEREEKKTSMQIGFNRQNVKKDDVVGQLELRQQLLKSGNVMPELVGRITQIVEVEELDTGAYRAILQREINCKKEFFRKEYGLSLEISDEAKEIMVRRFCNQEISMGARTVKNSLTELLGTAAFDAILEKKNLIMIDEEALKNGKPILLLSKDRCRGC